jgi:hypothetical protein
MLRPGYIIIALLFFSASTLTAQEFSAKEKAVIYTNAVKVLNDYQTISNQIGVFVINDVEKAKNSSERFLELFVNRQVMIYNDLDPSHKLSEFYEAETYSSNIILWYPDGLTIQLDLENARVSEIMSHENNVFSVDILVKKTMSGNYLNQTLNNNVEELTFRIAFGLENKSLVNFKIVGIRNASSNVMIDYSKALKEVNSEDFTADDLTKIQGELKNILKDYTNFLSLIGDPQEQAEDKEFYKSSFLKLFQSNETRVYNDIDPELQTNLLSLTEYLSAYTTDYPNGINNLSINTDSAKFGKIMKAEDGYFYTYVDANKFFSGSYKGKDAFSKMFPLIFKISFNAADKTFTGFVINSIDISSLNFYEASSEDASMQKPELVIKQVTRKGFDVSVIASFGQTQINSKDITSMTVVENNHSWDVVPRYGFISGFGLSYNFNDNLAIRTGVEFSTYSEEYSLAGKFTNDTVSPDINSTPFYKIIEADYDSLVKINFLSVPVSITYTSGKPGKYGIYIEAGSKISFPKKATFSDAGNYKTSGYYPSYPDVIKYLELPELGFYNRENINRTGEIEMKGINIALYGSIGVNIPLGYYSSIKVGPQVVIGFSDIQSNIKKYHDIFGDSYAHQPTKIKTIGLRVSFTYKL